MASMTGMDIGQVRELAKKLQKQAQAIQTVITTLDPAISSVEWKGKDAENFKQEWSGQHKKQLKTVMDALEKFSKTATDQAKQQEETSSK